MASEQEIEETVDDLVDQLTEAAGGLGIRPAELGSRVSIELQAREELEPA